MAQDTGLAELWLWEDCFWAGGMSAASALLAWTDRLHVGVGVFPVPLRNVALAASPVTLLSEYLPALRALLRGESVTAAGRYVTLDGVTLGWPPLAPVPVLSAAAGPRTLEASGRHADGTILDSGTTPDRTRAAREIIDRARAEAGRAEPHPIVVYLIRFTAEQVQPLLS